MMVKFFFTIILSTLILNGLSAQENCIPEKHLFNIGEKLTYTVSYNWFVVFADVGKAEFTTSLVQKEQLNLLHLKAFGYTNSWWDGFFKVRDTYESWVNPLTLKPYYFNRDVLEGDYKIDIQYTFDRKENIAYSKSKTNKNPIKYDTIGINNCTFDIMSVIYYSRNIDFENYNIGDTIPVDIMLDRELTNVYFRYLGKEQIKIKPWGRINCLKFSVLLVKGSVFKGGENLVVWASDDKNQIPVYAESPIIIGNVRIRLSDVENNKYPLKSFIDNKK